MAHLSLKQRSTFRKSFIPSRRQSRQTDAVYRAIGQFLQALHYLASFLPARTCEPVYRRESCQLSAVSFSTHNRSVFPRSKSKILRLSSACEGGSLCAGSSPSP